MINKIKLRIIGWILGIKFERVNESYTRVYVPERSKGAIEESVRKVREDADKNGYNIMVLRSVFGVKIYYIDKDEVVDFRLVANRGAKS